MGESNKRVQVREPLGMPHDYWDTDEAVPLTHYSSLGLSFVIWAVRGGVASRPPRSDG